MVQYNTKEVSVMKKIIKWIAEIVLGTFLWCMLDYFTESSINLVTNLATITLIVVLCNITDYLVKKYKNKKSSL